MPGSKALKVLVVDDEPSILSVTEQILRRAGHSVVKAGSPDHALQIYHTRKSEIDLVVCDMVMPGMNGREVARQIHSEPDSPPVILMSGSPDIGEPLTLTEGRLDGFL